MKWHISYDFMCCSRFTHYRMYKSTIYRFQSYLELPGKTQCQHFSYQKFMLLFCAQEVLISMAPLGVVPGKCGSDLGSVAGCESVGHLQRLLAPLPLVGKCHLEQQAMGQLSLQFCRKEASRHGFLESNFETKLW